MARPRPGCATQAVNLEIRENFIANFAVNFAVNFVVNFVEAQ